MADSAHVKEEGVSTPEANAQNEIVFFHKLVCQLCKTFFEEDIPIACVHVTFCRSCLKEYGLHRHVFSHDMVCTRCSGISVSRNQQWDSQQDILSMMHLLAKGRRGLLENCSNPGVNLLCQQLSDVLNITGDNGPERYAEPGTRRTISSEAVPDYSLPSSTIRPIQPLVPDGINSINLSQSLAETRSASQQGAARSSTPSIPGSPRPTNRGGTKPCRGPGCKTCALVMNACALSGLSGETVNVDGRFKCMSKRIFYCIFCNRCHKMYIGKTTYKLKERMSQHCRDIRKRNARSSVATHFNLHDHTIEDFKVCVIKSFHSRTSRKTMQKEEKEMMLRIGTIQPDGLNRIN